jgi:hypothetical protein
MRTIVCVLLILMSLSRSIPAQETLLKRDEADLLLGSGRLFEREEVLEIIMAIVQAADEEIIRTAEEAVKEAVLEEAPRRAYQESLAESWKKEAERRGKTSSFLKTTATVEAVVIGLLGLCLGLREVTR